MELLPGFGPGTSSLPNAFWCSQEASADPGESQLILDISRFETRAIPSFYQRIPSKTKLFHHEKCAVVREMLESVQDSFAPKTVCERIPAGCGRFFVL